LTAPEGARGVVRMNRLLLSAIVLLAGCATSPEEPAVTAAPVIAAERAFAARGAEIGWVAAFREFTAPDGMVGNFENAPQSLAATPDTGARNLFWWPAFAGIARSGDLGFTTGPFSVDAARTPRGQYFTVWRRQPDGSWKWIWDGGPGPRPDPLNHGVDAVDLPTLPVSAESAGSAETAIEQVRTIEAENASAGALRRYLGGGAQVYRAGVATGTPDMEAFVIPSADVAFTSRRVEVSAAGDLAFTLGEARWTEEGQERRGQYARIWQFRAAGWRIVYDQLVVLPPN
jgi:ketosteroid isomerase-like protein